MDHENHRRAEGRSRVNDPTSAQSQLAAGKRTLTDCLVVQPAEAAATGELAAIPSTASVPAPRAAPGVGGARPTLQMLFGAQRAATAAPVQDPAQVHASATRGTATLASRLPYADQIQRAFGRHDISRVQAHAGPEAEQSAHAMGARAYATGDHIVLGEGADLHTVAHEAAHVIQQRGGVQLKGGVGEVGDSYEQHADEVANRVVRGESAEVLLDRHALHGQAGDTPSVPAPSAVAIQCKTFDLGKNKNAVDTEDLDSAKKTIRTALKAGRRNDVERLFGELESHVSNLDDQLAMEKGDEELTAEHENALKLRKWIEGRPEFRAAEKAEAQRILAKKKQQAALKNESDRRRNQSVAARRGAEASRKMTRRAAVAQSEASRTGRAVLDSMELTGKYTQLGEVKFGKKNPSVHLSLPTFDSLYNDNPINSSQILSVLHITVEVYGRDDEKNPRYWIRREEFTGQDTLSTPSQEKLRNWAKHYRDILEKIFGST